MKRLATLLRVKPEEGRMVLLVSLLFLCIQAGQGLGDNAASALFFLRFGVDFLPYMYLLLGGTTVVLTMAYSAALGRFKRSLFFQALLGGAVLLLLLERAALLRPFSWLYPILWLTISCTGMILGTFVWNVAGAISDARQAKRLFPLYTSAGILGSVAGNSITGLAAKGLGTDNLLIFFAALLAASYLLVRSVAARYFQQAKPQAAAGFWSDIRAGYDFVRGSALMRWMAYASVLFSILFFSIAFPFNKVVTASFPDEASVAGYLGLFSGISTAATFLVSLLLANRVYARLGIVNSVLILPITYLLGFVVFAGQYNLTGGVIARFAQLVILSGVAGTAWNALFNVVPSQKRGQVLAFENGVPSQIGVALSGLLLILGTRVLTTTQIFLMGMVVTVACGFMVWKMRAAYGEALVEALRAGRFEVFTGDQPGFAGLQNDAAALQVLTGALRDAKPMTRRMAAQIMEKLGNPSAAPALREQAADPEPGVRAAALSALGTLQDESAAGIIEAGLGDLVAGVRLQALKALGQLKPEIAKGMQAEVVAALDDASRPVRMQAAITLARIGQTELAWRCLAEALADAEPERRIAALDAIGMAAAFFDGQINAATVVRLLDDTNSRVRVAACQALRALHDPGSIQALIERLHDPEASVRRGAAQALRMQGAEAWDPILDALEAESGEGCDAALDALPRGAAQISGRLRGYARTEIGRLREMTTLEASLPRGGRALRLLSESMRHSLRRGHKRLLKVMGLLGAERTMELVESGMSDSDPEGRAAALEALETLGDKALAREIISLLEQEPRRRSPEAVIAQIIRGDNRWERALAIRAAQELGLKGLADEFAVLQDDPDALIAGAARDALTQWNEVKPLNTLQTVSTLERMLLLRDIPIFSELSPEDLQQIATIAKEAWFPADTEIFGQDEPGDVMYVIVDGHVHVVRKSDGKELVLAQRGPGDFVGEMAIIDSAPRWAGLFTLGEVRVLSIDGETFKEILRERPQVSLAVMRSLSRRLKEAER